MCVDNVNVVGTSLLVVVDLSFVVVNLVVGVLVVVVKGVVVVVVVTFLGKQKSVETSIIDVNASLEIFKKAAIPQDLVVYHIGYYSSRQVF